MKINVLTCMPDGEQTLTEAEIDDNYTPPVPEPTLDEIINSILGVNGDE